MTEHLGRYPTCHIRASGASLIEINAVCTGELAVGITAVLHKQDLEPYIQKAMQQQMDNYGRVNNYLENHLCSLLY